MKTPQKQIPTIFSDEVIDHYISGFNSAYLPGYEAKLEIIGNWIRKLTSGTLQTLKEEEIKSRFLNDFFGDILGFNGNSERWSLREEKRVKYDATKADGALGFFSKENDSDDTRAVIEIKDASTDLDKRQTGHQNKTSVEQAFAYAHKMGRRCAWVIVSNFKEIRFYAAGDSNCCQSYNLEDLADPDVLRKLLFLFHRDRLIAQKKPSKTEKFYAITETLTIQKKAPLHILDQIYYSLKRFEGLEFVDPKYLCNLKPFNILEEQVWHYSNGILTTLNPLIHELLCEVSIADQRIEITKDYALSLVREHVYDPLGKLKWIFTFLNKCAIRWINAIRDYKKIEQQNRSVVGYSSIHSQNSQNEYSILKNVVVFAPESCDCVSCNYKSLQFKRLLGKLEASNGDISNYTMETAYGNYLTATCNFKITYSILRNLEKYKFQENKDLEYFIVKINQKALHNLITGYYAGTDSTDIAHYLKSLDIDNIIHNELDFGIDADVRNYLLQIKEERLLQRIKSKIQELLGKVNELKDLYDTGGKQTVGPDLIQQLQDEYFMLSIHINRNFIILDIFTHFRLIALDVFSALVTHHEIKEVGLKEFNDYFILEGILHISPDKYLKILAPVSQLRVNPESVSSLIKKFKSFFTSFYDNSPYTFDSLMNTNLQIHSQYHNFKEKLSSIFSNIFVTLLKIDISPEQMSELEQPLRIFLKDENFLAHYNLERLAKFIEHKGDMISHKELIRILEIAILNDKHDNIKYHNIITSTCKAIRKFYPSELLSNIALTRKALANCHSTKSQRTDYKRYIHLVKIVDVQNKGLIIYALNEHLINEFNADFYQDLLYYNIIDHHYGDHFKKYIAAVALRSKRGLYFEAGKENPYKSNYDFMRFFITMKHSNIKLPKRVSAQFKELPLYEKWPLNPTDFDYAEFQIFWLYSVPKKFGIMEELALIPNIKLALVESLKTKHEDDLSIIYTQYFL